MRSAKHGMRTLGLAILVVTGVMAVGATGAQGQLPGESKSGTYLVNLAPALLAIIEAKQIGITSFLVPARSFEIKCTAFHIEGKISTSTDAEGKLVSLGCLSFDLMSGEILPCDMKTLGTVTAKVLVLPILHSGEPFLLFEPLPGETNFTTVAFKGGTECTLPLNNAINGSISAKVDELDAVEQLILYSEEIQLLTGDKLAFGLNQAYIDRHAIGFLVGSHEGQKIGVH
ncbi:MAG TPA: hypothetical protein VNO20_07265 [Solirubrobacterales bacterium]|nr:hypothetical protein [Solirubrobacterales bacterium]